MEWTDLQPRIHPTASYCPLVCHAHPSLVACDDSGFGMGVGALRQAHRSIGAQPAQAGRPGHFASMSAVSLQ